MLGVSGFIGNQPPHLDNPHRDVCGNCRRTLTSDWILNKTHATYFLLDHKQVRDEFNTDIDVVTLLCFSFRLLSTVGNPKNTLANKA